MSIDVLNKRLFDLVRFMRTELHSAFLITDEEYEMLAKEDDSVIRLQDYDELRGRHLRLQARFHQLEDKLENR